MVKDEPIVGLVVETIKTTINGHAGTATTRVARPKMRQQKKFLAKLIHVDEKDMGTQQRADPEYHLIFTGKFGTRKQQHIMGLSERSECRVCGESIIIHGAPSV